MSDTPLNSNNFDNGKNQIPPNGNGNMPKKNNFIWILLIAAIAVFLFSQFSSSFTKAFGNETQEVEYSTFLQMLDDDRVTTVIINNNSSKVTFKAVDNDTKDADDNPVEKNYYTGTFSDPDLIERLQKAKTPTGGEISFTRDISQGGNIFLEIVVTYLPLLILFGLMFLVMRPLMKKMGGGMGGIGKANAKVYSETKTGVTFKDVAGEDEAKDALSEIVDFLHSPKKYNSIGAKMPRGILLVGPPGTGKTLLAKAVAGEANVQFLSIAGSEFVEMFVGQGAARVRDLFKQAQEKAPCIVFIDEIDAIGKKRDSSGINGNDEREQTLNQLLSEMDGFDPNNGVIILAATNRPESLDAALLRPGRFDRRVPVELPDLKGREEILQVHAKKVVMDDNIDFNIIARSTAGASGADLANIINESALLAVKNNRRMVIQKDLMDSVETVLAGYERKGKVINPKERKIVAYHEIGHALVAAKQKDSAPVTKITIIPRTSGALGYTMQVDEEELNLLSKEELLNRITTLTGGRSAEEVIFKSITSGASNDIEKITKMARMMVTRYGMTEEFGMMALDAPTSQYLGDDSQLTCSPETATEIDKQVLTIISACHAKSRKILQDNQEKLHELADFLMDKETITGEEFMEILHGTKKSVPDVDTQVEKSEQEEQPENNL